MDARIAAENAQERRRLGELVGRLTDEEMCLEAGAGWTVAALLAHMAFWDYRALVLVNR